MVSRFKVLSRPDAEEAFIPLQAAIDLPSGSAWLHRSQAIVLPMRNVPDDLNCQGDRAKQRADQLWLA